MWKKMDGRGKGGGQNGCLVKPAKEVHNSSASSSNTASASSLNNPAGNQSSSSANQNAYLGSHSLQNTNQNHGNDTYVSLMSSFEDSRIQSKYKRRKQTKPIGKMALQNTSVIDLDSSLDLTTPFSYHDSIMDGEVFNTSNNSTPNTSWTSAHSGSSLTEQKFVCSVLNCAAFFSSEIRLEDHMQLFKHSPCNPCLLNRNCCLQNIPICYMCPGCDREFSTCDECKEHINRSNHLTFYPPLAIQAYMCSQCLFLFPSIDSCWRHMEHTSHHGMYYPFANDYTTEERAGGPVAVAEELVQDLVSKCNKVVYTVQCLECGMPMETPAILKHHMRETQDQHIVAALTETSLVEVFASYLASYSCNVCHRLFSGGLKELAKHQCAKRVIGTITENDTRSFAEYIKRCALSLIKSLEPENMPGPSRPVRSSPVREKKTKRLEFIHDAATEASGNLSGQRKVQPEQSHQSDSRDATGTSNEYASVCESKQGTSQKVRKSRWNNQSDSSIANGMLEDFFAAPRLTSSDMNKTEKNPKKKEIVEKETKNPAVITIGDTDDGSDEADVDFPPESGAKRKRKKRTASNSKKGSSDDLSSEPIIISASPDATKVNSGKPQKSPFFVTNYKPRTSSFNANVLTQGYVVQPSENHMCTLHALIGRNNQVQPQETSPVRYKLRNRNVSETVTTAENSDADPLISAWNSDEGFRNIAQTCLQGVGSIVPRDTGSRGEIQTEDLQLCRRDRSRSPLQNLSTYNALDEPYNTAFSAASFPAHPSSQLSNVLTQGHVDQPHHDPFLAVQDVLGRLRPVYQPQIAGPSQYQIGNQSSTAVVQPMAPSSVLPTTLRSQAPTVGHLVYPQTCSRALRQETSYGNLTQAANSNMKNGDKSFLPLSEITPVADRNKPERKLPRKPSNESMVSTAHLQHMKNIVFLDLDNWPSFFHKLPRCLPDFTFVWGFFGGKNPWYEPNGVAIFRQMKQKGMFYLNERCGITKDAADFAIVLTVGKMDEKLPYDIAFTIMSGDKGFCEVERQMRDSERKVMVVNPHTAAQFSNDMIYALVTSVTDT